MSQTNTDEKGESYRLTAKHVWSNNASSDITIGRTDREFTQSNGGVSADRQEIKLQHSHKLDKKTRFTIEGTHSESLSEEQKNQTLGATLQTRKGKWLLEGGLRHIEQQSAVSTTKTETFRVGLKRGIKLLEHNGRIGLGYEQDMNDSSRHYLTADAEMAVNKNASIYGRYETGSDLTGALGLANSTLSKRFILGAKSKISPQMNLYSEYRSRDLTGALAAETASGLRGSITVEKGLTLTPSLEIVKTIDGDTLQDSVAASLAVTDVRDHDKRKTLRVETRQGESSNSYTIEGSYIERLDDVWTAVFREELRATTSDTEGDYGSHVFTLGLAQRQRDNGKHNSLYLYQWKENKGINTTSDRSVHLLSTQQHYQANDELEFTVRLGGKIQTTHLAGQNHRMDVVLLDGKTSYAIDDRVDLFVRAGVLGSEHFDEQHYSAGLGVNMTVKDNIRIGLGYNDSGFDDEDLDIDKQNADGFFVNLTLKADERWFEWQDKKNKKGVE
jgi:opacity protein-like surface antigen